MSVEQIDERLSIGYQVYRCDSNGELHERIADDFTMEQVRSLTFLPDRFYKIKADGSLFMLSEYVARANQRVAAEE